MLSAAAHDKCDRHRNGAGKLAVTKHAASTSPAPALSGKQHEAARSDVSEHQMLHTSRRHTGRRLEIIAISPTRPSPRSPKDLAPEFQMEVLQLSTAQRRRLSEASRALRATEQVMRFRATGPGSWTILCMGTGATVLVPALSLRSTFPARGRSPVNKTTARNIAFACLFTY